MAQIDIERSIIAPAAFFQPKKIIKLVKVAMENPVVPNPAVPIPGEARLRN